MSVLPPEVIAAAKKAATDGLAKLALAEAEIRKAKTAGIDVSQLEQRVQQLRQQIAQFRAVYG